MAIALVLAARTSVFATPPDLAGDAIPAGASVRLGTIRFRLDGSMQGAITFAPDSKHVITPARPGLSVWDALSGRMVHKVPLADFVVNELLLSPDGKLIAGSGHLQDSEGMPQDQAIRLFDAVTLREARTLRLKGRSMRAPLAFTPDSKILATVTEDGHASLWDVASGVELLRMKLFSDAGGHSVSSLQFSPDGRYLAAGDRDGGLIVWEWQTPAEPRKVPTAGDDLCSIAFSPDARTLAIVGREEFGVQFWDVATWRRRTTLRLGDSGYDARIAYTPDGNYFVATAPSKRAIQVHEAATGRLVHTLDCRPNQIGSILAIAPDSSALASMAGGVRVWDLASGHEHALDLPAHSSTVSCVAFAPQRSLIATADDGGVVIVWNSQTSRAQWVGHHAYEDPRYAGCTAMVRALAFSPDGTLLATSGLDDWIRVWESATGREIYRLPGHGLLGGSRALGFTPDGKRLASWGDDFYVRVWDLRNGKALLEHLTRPTGLDIPNPNDRSAQAQLKREMLGFSSAVFMPGCDRLVLGYRDKSYVFEVATGRQLRAIPRASGFIQRPAISPDGTLLAVSGQSPSIKTKLPDGSVRYSQGRTSYIDLWDLASGKHVRRIAGPDGWFERAVAFSPDGRTIAFAVGDSRQRLLSRILLYEAATGKQTQVIDSIPDTAICLAFSPDGKQLAAGFDNTTVLIWDLARPPANGASRR
jgi:WD40 repeat protein